MPDMRIPEKFPFATSAAMEIPSWQGGGGRNIYEISPVLKHLEATRACSAYYGLKIPNCVEMVRVREYVGNYVTESTR